MGVCVLICGVVCCTVPSNSPPCCVPLLSASRCCDAPVLCNAQTAKPAENSPAAKWPVRESNRGSWARVTGHGRGQGPDTHVSPGPKDRLHTGRLSMLVSVSYLLLRLLTLLHYSLHCSLYCFCMNSAYIPATWIPHSVFGRPFHLPSRSSSPSATGCVECQSPTDL